METSEPLRAVVVNETYDFLVNGEALSVISDESVTSAPYPQEESIMAGKTKSKGNFFFMFACPFIQLIHLIIHISLFISQQKN